MTDRSPAGAVTDAASLTVVHELVDPDEVFVVISGDATVEFTEPALPSIRLVPGSVVRLEAGMRTVWTVRETLRKVYVAG